MPLLCGRCLPASVWSRDQGKRAILHASTRALFPSLRPPFAYLVGKLEGDYEYNKRREKVYIMLSALYPSSPVELLVDKG